MDSPHLQSIAIALFTFLIFLCYALHRRSSKSNRRVAPEPVGAWPIIGHLHLLGGDANQLLHHKLGEMAETYGPAFTIRLGKHRALVVSSSEVARECFTINDRVLVSRPKTTATKLLCFNDAVFGFAPFSSYWREMRKIVMHELLSNQRLDILLNVLNSEVNMTTKNLYGLWEKNKHHAVLVDLSHLLEDLLFNVIVRIVAGKCYTGVSSDDEARRYQNAIAQFSHLMGISVISDALPFLWWLDLHGNEKAMKKTAEKLDAMLGGWLSEHRQRRLSGEIKAEEEQDFMDLMLSLEEEGRFSDFPNDANTCIKANCLTVTVGASSSTSAALTWAISLLLNNRAALRKAQEELDLHVGTERHVNESDIKNLVYLQAVVKETLRLQPVSPVSPRETLEDCTIAGYHVPAGTRLILNIWKIQRDPSFWTNPTAFEPERFLTTHKDVDVRGQQFELIPFGSGRRSCPGASFALQGFQLILARLLHAFDLATPMDQPVDMTEKPGLTVPKATPLEVLLSPRLPDIKLYGF